MTTIPCPVCGLSHVVAGRGVCQRCLNRLDAPMRRRNAARTRDGKKAIGDLFAE